MSIQKEGNLFVARYNGFTTTGNTFHEAIDLMLRIVSE